MGRLATIPMDPRDLLDFAVPGSLSFITGGSPLDSGYWLSSGNTASGFLHTVSQSLTDLYCGFFLNPNSASNDSYLLSFYSDTVRLGGLRYQNTASRIELVANNLAVKTTATQIQPTATNHLQCRYKLGSAGVFELKVNNTVETLTFNGNTVAGGATKINRIAFEATSSGTYFDAFWLNDTSGSENNGYDGALRMKVLPMVADSQFSGGDQWSRSTGVDGYLLIRNTPFGSTYVYSNVNSQYQFFVPAAHGLSAPAVIHAISARHVARMVSRGEFEPNFVLGGLASPSSIRTLSVSPAVIMDRRTVNPFTFAPLALTDQFELGMRSIL